MASTHPPSHVYSVPPPPNMQDRDVRLPSLKDLNFQYRPPPSQDGAPPQNGSAQPDHSRSARHDPAWSRSASSSGQQPTAQHPSSMSVSHESPKSQYPPQKQDGVYMTPGMPMSQQGAQAMSAGGPGAGSPREAPSQNPGKRPRSGSVVSASPGRSHNTYPPPPPPSYSQPPQHPSFQQAPPVPIPPSHDSIHPPPGFSHPPPPGYAPYPPPPHMVPRHYAMPPPGMHQNPPTNSYPPPMPPDHWSHHQPPPPHQQYQHNGFPRTTALVPANVESRGNAPPPGDMEKRQGTIEEIMKHCSALYTFANRYAQSHPGIQPSHEELQEMSQRATAVVRLLEELRRLTVMAEEVAKEAASMPLNPSEEHARPPKRPWEDMSREEEGAAPHEAPFPEYPQGNDNAQSTAEQDMEIIRSKRATSTGGNAPGQPKSKYRKRSRATPPGKCHSCNIRETPEWRRGPDGARTLCNACGLHYAKLMRKRDKGADGKPTPIDMQTLRASTASARGSDPAEQSQSQMHHQSPGAGPASYEKQPPPMGHHPSHPPHQGPYHLMPVAGSAPPPVGSGPPGGPHQMMPPPPPPASHSETGVPPPPWLSSSSSGRGGYAADHQSYMRTSHPPSHARASPPQ